MAKPNSSKTKWIWLSVLVLFVCVAATAIAFFSRLDMFLLNDTGAIPLITDPTGTDDGSDETGDPQETTAPQSPTGGSGDPSGAGQNDSGSTEDAPQSTGQTFSPGFEASDDKTVWTTNTQVEIFRVSYENGQQVITVDSADGDKLVAPGTENSYTFKLKNTGDVALDYTVEVDAYIIPGEVAIPVTGRINRYDGKWLAGGQDAYAEVAQLDSAEDNGTLGAGKYTYYTLDWMWPFETGNDVRDTNLGNLAVDEDLTFTIVIRTYATQSDDPSGGGGITPPQTGDNMALGLWVALAITSFAMLIFLLFYKNKEKKRSEPEVNEH